MLHCCTASDYLLPVRLHAAWHYYLLMWLVKHLVKPPLSNILVKTLGQTMVKIALCTVSFCYVACRGFWASEPPTTSPSAHKVNPWSNLDHILVKLAVQNVMLWCLQGALGVQTVNVIAISTYSQPLVDLEILVKLAVLNVML
jgi:hypothetical protein